MCDFKCQIPLLLALSQQDVPQLRLEADAENLAAKGAYILRQYGEGRDIALIATGTELALAVEAAGKSGWTRYVASKADVIGMPVFGAPARAERPYQEFGITNEAIIARALPLTGR